MIFSTKHLAAAFWAKSQESFQASSLEDATRFCKDGAPEIICEVLLQVAESPYPPMVKEVVAMNEIRRIMTPFAHSEENLLKLKQQLTILKNGIGQDVTNIDALLCRIRANIKAEFLRFPGDERKKEKMSSLEEFCNELEQNLQNTDAMQQPHFSYEERDIWRDTKKILDASKKEGADKKTDLLDSAYTFQKLTLKAKVRETVRMICSKAFYVTSITPATQNHSAMTPATTAVARPPSASLLGSPPARTFLGGLPADASVASPPAPSAVGSPPTTAMGLVGRPTTTTTAASLVTPGARPIIYRNGREESFSPQKINTIRHWVLLARATARLRQVQLRYDWVNLKNSEPLLFQDKSGTQLKDKARNLFKPHDIFDLYDMLPGEQNQA
mmetsp:Transcript_38495/g.93149  ORF Transcript_38495/g.93149 Transcript_38495/m.93149 type:complete len:386 (-) Transcript_38495:161-1318(-)|eukprot:CAMPEP_0113632634 /NCGR_PEP_ID=MMETSP0017_2-20120614/16969_1 /TAXON_ID=2856 /ORGANISM="Cylindrotheca closterium" /LENGTH=385 /DNA_ID=CAMNT_0000543211 /DNA_START=66 /DNA_END=1223 /DNA_ORIENTATION=- /assembly_acc=CAM_ASM_000147